MQLAIFHLFGALFSIATALLGQYWRHHPASFVKFFTFGAHDGTGFPRKIGLSVGWFFFIFGAIGALFYLILIPVDLVSSTH